MKKYVLKHSLCPGDIMMLTAAIRDLHITFPDQYQTDVRTPCDAIWENNPYIIKLDENDDDVKVLECEYPLIHRSNTSPYHFIHGFHDFLSDQLEINLRPIDFKGDIHLSEDEQSWMSQVQEIGLDDDFWVIVAGGKTDFSSKWWNPDWYQQVVNHFLGRITFVQVGEKGHFHPKLENVIDLIGKTDARQFIRLVYHSVGVLCPVTWAMHLAAAAPVKPGRPLNRAAVVIAGGREPPQWEAYPHHRFLAVNGSLDCCDNGGCWKSRCQKIGDGDIKDRKDLCEYPVRISDHLVIPRCMDMIKPMDVIRAIEWYYEGGALHYGSDAEKIKQIRQKQEVESSQKMSSAGSSQEPSES